MNSKTATYTIEQMLHLFNTLESQMKTNAQQQGQLEQEVVDIEHYAEFAKFSASQGYKLLKEIKDAKQKRRGFKDENELLNPVKNFLEKHKVLKNDLVNLIYAINDAKQRQKDRKYTPRVRADLFQGGN